MVSVLAVLRGKRRGLVSKSDTADITESDNLPWKEVGSADRYLQDELEMMYWSGVKQEVENVLVTLRYWQQPAFSGVSRPDETDDFIHGFDTFVDQVTIQARKFAERYGGMKERFMKIDSETTGSRLYIEALRYLLRNSATKKHNAELKARLRESIENSASKSRPTTLVERRARRLLQSAAFLDIEKLIEHRPPLDDLSFWRRAAIPQLHLVKFSKHSIPIFMPLICSECNKVIRGSMFRLSNREIQPKGSDLAATVICEDSYRRLHFGKDKYVKDYKHCVLQEAITPKESRRICLCADVCHFDNSGRSISLFPVSMQVKHNDTRAAGGLQCGLLKFGELVAKAKFDSIQIGLANVQKGKKNAKDVLLNVGEKTLVDQENREPTTSFALTMREAEADKDIRFSLKKNTEKYPFGNVHMALAIGPLVIENGVANTKRGALVTTRNPSCLQVVQQQGSQRRLAVSGSYPRGVWAQECQIEMPKRYKTVIKQVVGTPFAGVDNIELEEAIIRMLVKASKQPFDHPGLSRDDQRRQLNQLVNDIFPKVKQLLEPNLKRYLSSITSALLDAETNLTWSARENNCQNFCDALISRDLFGPLVGQALSLPKPSNPPLYLLSFITRQTSYSKHHIKTKFDVPNGLTEEYLLRLRYGRHDDSDILDTLQEYFHDWGAFGGTLYPYQDLFPWDCTEAYGRYPVTCGECNLAKHVWAFPFDSFSMISLHLSRPRCLCPPSEPRSFQPLDDKQWMFNRITVITAREKLLAAAAAMAKDKIFYESTKWLSDPSQQNDSQIDRLKLGGIHRAQPSSYSFDTETGDYCHHFIAEWAHLERSEQIKRYEELRDGRVKMVDVGVSPKPAGDGRQCRWEKVARSSMGIGARAGEGTAMAMDAGFLPGDGASYGFGVAVGGVDGDGVCASNCGTGCGSASADCSSGGGCGGGGDGGCGGGGCGGGGGGGCGGD